MSWNGRNITDKGKDARFNNRKDNNHKTVQKFNNGRNHS